MDLVLDDAVRRSLGELRQELPDELNIAQVVCDRIALQSPDAPAVIEDLASSGVSIKTFSDLKRESDQIAGLLQGLGVLRSDRIALHLPQGVELLAALLGILKLGAIATPIATVYGPEGLATRLEDSEARALITDETGVSKLEESQRLASLERTLVTTRGDLCQEAAFSGEIALTRAGDPALLFYTSGTSGEAKGVLLAHRMVLAQLPGFRLVFDLAPQPDDIFWTPSEWSWLGGLQVVLPALYFGCPVVASSQRFSAEGAYRLLATHKITCPFLAPAALRRLRAEPPLPGEQFAVRAIMTGGEGYSPEVLAWARERFSCSVNDDYGLTEANDLAVSCGALFSTPDGAAGRPPPGRRVAVIDELGEPVPAGTIGQIALDASDPIRMLRYWHGPEVNVTGTGWFGSGDLGYFDEEGFLYVLGRRDDLILVSGYRVGPEEVESQLMGHEGVAEAGVVGIPGKGGGQTVGACVVLRPGLQGSQALVQELQALVRERLAPYAYPRQIEFVERLPTSTTGKIKRRELRRLLVPEINR